MIMIILSAKFSINDLGWQPFGKSYNLSIFRGTEGNHALDLVVESNQRILFQTHVFGIWLRSLWVFIKDHHSTVTRNILLVRIYTKEGVQHDIIFCESIISVDCSGITLILAAVNVPVLSEHKMDMEAISCMAGIEVTISWCFLSKKAAPNAKLVDLQQEWQKSRYQEHPKWFAVCQFWIHNRQCLSR